MGWGGIQNLPPGFDVFEGKQPPPNIVDEAVRGKVAGLSPGRERLFADLKRNLLHQDFLRYFDSSRECAGLLIEIEDGKYTPRVLTDIVEPALVTALAQLRAIQKEVEQSRTSGRKLLYEPLTSMNELFRRSHVLADIYPEATGSKTFDATAQGIIDAVAAMAGDLPE